MTRELLPCHTCRAEFGDEHLAHGLEVLLADDVEQVSMCVQCMADFEDSIVDDAGRRRWVSELTLLATARPGADATDGERRVHAFVCSSMRDDHYRGLVATEIATMGAEDALAALEARDGRDAAIEEIEWILNTWEQRRQVLEGDLQALRACETAIEELRAQLYRITG